MILLKILKLFLMLELFFYCFVSIIFQAYLEILDHQDQLGLQDREVRFYK